MSQVIAFPGITVRYPKAATDLPKAECILLVAIRVWVDGLRQNTDPLPSLRHGFSIAGAPDAAASVDMMMRILARAARHPLMIHRPSCPCLSQEEKQLLRAASLAQSDQEHLAETALRRTLLSAHGAEFALGPLLGIGRLFAAARLWFEGQNSSAERDGDQAAAWSCAAQATVH